MKIHFKFRKNNCSSWNWNLKKFSEKIKLDPFLILEVNRTADWKTIKLSYFKLARLYHPDMNKNDERAQKKFLQVKEAYEYFERKYNPDKYANIKTSFNTKFDEAVEDDKVNNDGDKNKYESIREKNKKNKSHMNEGSFTINPDEDPSTSDGNKFSSWVMDEKIKLNLEKQVYLKSFLFVKIPVPRSEKMIDRLNIKAVTAQKHRMFGPEDYMGFLIFTIIIGIFIISRINMYYTNSFDNLENVNIYNALKPSEVVKIYDEKEIPPVEQIIINTKDHQQYKEKENLKYSLEQAKTAYAVGAIKDVAKVDLKKKFNSSL
jgi:curved DNA-binding protein CbpA